MADLAKIAALIVEAVALDDSVDTVVQTADDNWVVRLDAVDIEVGIDTERNRLVLATSIGQPLGKRRAEMLEALLTFNALLRETGGVRMAMSEGEVMQIVDVALDGLVAGTLATVLANFAEKTLVWRAYVATTSAGGAAAAPSPASDAVHFKA